MTLRILGIDPGLRTTGFGVIDVVNASGTQLNYVASGTISTIDSTSKKNTPNLHTNNLPQRLKILFTGIRELIETYQPHIASVEIVFVNVNPQSTLLLGQARGACITALVAHDVAVAEYTALQMKQAVVGYGRAQKHQIQEMVKRLLHLPSEAALGSDAADALGMAIAHAHAQSVLYKLQKGTGLPLRVTFP